MNEPTPTQLQVLTFWQTYRNEHGYWPTLAEAARARGCNSVSVLGIVQACIRKGLMERSGPQMARNYRVSLLGRTHLPEELKPPEKPSKPGRRCWPIAGTLSEKGIVLKQTP